MTQIWTTNNKGDKIIAFANNTLYKANPKNDRVSLLVAKMQANDFSDPAIFGLRLDMIRTIQWQEGKDYIQVFFRSSEEHFIIKDDALREEIFNYLKAHTPGNIFGIDKFDRLRAAKKPLAALAVVAGLLIYTLCIMSTLEKGGNVVAYGRIAALVVGLTSLGFVNIMLIYGALIAIAGFSAFKKMMNPPVIHVIRLGA
jgi:hypothetical protein